MWAPCDVGNSRIQLSFRISAGREDSGAGQSSRRRTTHKSCIRDIRGTLRGVLMKENRVFPPDSHVTNSDPRMVSGGFSLPTTPPATPWISGRCSTELLLTSGVDTMIVPIGKTFLSHRDPEALTSVAWRAILALAWRTFPGTRAEPPGVEKPYSSHLFGGALPARRSRRQGLHVLHRGDRP